MTAVPKTMTNTVSTASVAIRQGNGMFGIKFHTPKTIRDGNDQYVMRVIFRRASSLEAGGFPP